MRQRKVKHQEERLLAAEGLTLPDARQYRGRWGNSIKTLAPAFRGDCYFEIGCGRGHFLTAIAADHPESFYIGAEGRPAILLAALERTARLELANVRYIGEAIDDPTLYFASGELAGLFVHFCDPWPKARHAKRRLTHRRYLTAYRQIVRPGGAIEIKTDDDALFAFTLEECRAAGLLPKVVEFDLHRTDLPARQYQTQYEHRFRLLGKPIHYCRIEIRE